MSQSERELIDAVLYALREGCFFPVREPKMGAVQQWRKWGALRNLHNKIQKLAVQP